MNVNIIVFLALLMSVVLFFREILINTNKTKKEKYHIKPQKAEIISKKDLDKVIRITYSDNSFEEFIGSSTVWRKLPMMERPTILDESRLRQIEKYIDYWGVEWPNGHERIKND